MKSENAVGFGLLFALAAVAALVPSCAGGAKPEGTEGGPCYGNDSCNTGLACLSHLCVNAAGYVTADAAASVDAPAADATPAEDVYAYDGPEVAPPPPATVYTGACGISSSSQGCSDCLNDQTTCCSAGMVCLSILECEMCMNGLLSGVTCTKNMVYANWLMCAADNCSIECGGGG
jgi:hypothetical protein